MLERLKELNRERKRLGLWEIQIRIGIHSGDVIIGNVGSYEKMDYTAVGSTVNLTQRLEAHARPNTVLISKATYQQISGHFACYRRLPFIPKGFEQEVENWEVRGARNLVRFTPIFINNGEVITPEPDVITLDIENDIFPEKQRDKEHICTSSQIYRYPHLVLDHDGIDTIEPVKIAIRHQPGFDAILAAYFSQYLFENGVLPIGARELSEYTKLVVSDQLPLSDSPWDTPYGVLQGIFEKDRRYCEEKRLPPEVSDSYRLQRGFYLLEYLCLRVAEGLSLYDPNLFEEDYPFEQERKLMRELLSNTSRGT
jgi:hypothetical protein